MVAEDRQRVSLSVIALWMLMIINIAFTIFLSIEQVHFRGQLNSYLVKVVEGEKKE